MVIEGGIGVPKFTIFSVIYVSSAMDSGDAALSKPSTQRSPNAGGAKSSSLPLKISPPSPSLPRACRRLNITVATPVLQLSRPSMSVRPYGS
ncbi:hypothetical protein SDJN03_20659, partial [Cucurbita argyrosperma subsp. sororia]